MRRFLIVSLSIAAIVSVLGLSGCAGHGESSSLSEPVTPPPTTAAAPLNPGPLPAPETLTDVMYRLADPAVPGADKLHLVQNAAASDAATLDTFAAALRDGGFTPLTFTATEVKWSDTQPGDTLATIKVTTANPGSPAEFVFPMQFRPVGGGWQLSRQTADMLLNFGNAHTEAAPASPADTTSTPGSGTG